MSKSRKPTRSQDIICLVDSEVALGAISKGRSSSYKLNGILRGSVGYLVALDISLKLIWIPSGCNPADAPSRFEEQKERLDMPHWLASHFEPQVDNIKGLEIFSGSGTLTACCVSEGLPMFHPFDTLHGEAFSAFAERIDRWIVGGLVAFVWLGPPCKSFSSLRYMDKGGPLRPTGNPEGNEEVPEIKIGNELWRRALAIADLCYQCNVPFCIEHPRNSVAWKWNKTCELQHRPGVNKIRVDWCAYGAETQKPTYLLTSMPWLKDICQLCPKNHVHAPCLRGARALAAAAYPKEFCRDFARGYKLWAGK